MKSIWNKSGFTVFIVCLLLSAMHLSDNHTSKASTTTNLLPSADEIIVNLKEEHPNQNHPRIMATDEDFVRIRQNVANDPLVEQWYEHLKSSVENSFEQSLPEHVLPDGVRLLGTSRRVLQDIQELGMMYQIDGDQQYVDRAWDILHAAGSFPDWNPSHFLDVAEMTAGFAIGYDWFYYAWSDEQRDFIRESIVTKGLDPALDVYRGETTGGFNWNHTGWLTTTNNWNTVVNGGIALGALAVADDSPELELLAGEILESGIDSIQLIFPLFEPDGASIEGISYWDYNAKYLVYYLSSLSSALGTDYGMSDNPGIDKTAYFPIYMAGTAGSSFNFGDSYPGIISTPIFFWLADRYDDPGIAWYQRNLLEMSNGQESGALDLLWYDAELASKPELMKDKEFRYVEVGSMRGDWNDPNSNFVGFKGGDNQFNHRNLDLGTFVLDALGERWATELGSDSYSLPGYFDDEGVNYYRIRPEGQNTLVLNPGQDPGQNPEATADIVNSDSSADHAFMITDLTEAYMEQATEVKRGIALIDHRRNVLLQDEITLKETGELYWFMHTDAEIDIIDEGKSAILQQNDRRLWAHIVTPGDLSFHVRDAEPLPTSPYPEGQGVNTQSKLTIHADDINELQLAVLFVPLMPWEEVPSEMPEIIDLDEWQIQSEALPTLDSITIDGQPLSGFEADKYTYHLGVLSSIPDVAASAANDTLLVNIDPSDTLPGTTTITVQSSNGQGRVAEYRIHVAGGVEESPVAASEHDGNVPENTRDGDLNTRWSALGEQWIQYKMEEQHTIDYVDMAFFNGDKRSTILDILVSTDGLNWTEVFSGQSSGLSSELERFEFDPISARYIRILGHGNTSSGWNSISEVNFVGAPIIDFPLLINEVHTSLDSSTIIINRTTQLRVEVEMSDGSQPDWSQASIKYISADPSVASVDEFGMVQGNQSGSTRISAEVTFDGFTKVSSTIVSVGEDAVIHKYSTGDSFVRGGDDADKNYGSLDYMMVKDGSGSFGREGFMKFDLGELEGTILSATLQIHAKISDNGGTEGDLQVYSVNGPWEETTITGNNRPTILEEDKLGSIFVDSEENWRELDITSYVQDRYNANEEVNLYFNQDRNGAGLNTLIRTRESSNIPYLRIVLESASEPQPDPDSEPEYEIVTQGQNLYLGPETMTFIPGHEGKMKAIVYPGILEQAIGLLRNHGKNSTILLDNNEHESEQYAIQLNAMVVNQAVEAEQLIFKADNGHFFLPEINVDLDAVATELNASKSEINVVISISNIIQTSHVQLPPNASPNAQRNHAPVFDYIITAEANGNSILLDEYEQM